MADIGLNEIRNLLNAGEEHLHVAASIQKAVSTRRTLLFECAKCRRKFKIPGAREGAAYQCISCKAVMGQLPDSTLQILQPSEAELVLDETIPPEIQRALQNHGNIVGRYVIAAKSGESAFKAFDLELARHVTLNEINRDLAGDLQTKIRQLAALEHKCIARIYDLFTSGDRSFVVQQYVDGMPLITAGFSLETLLNAYRTICEAVDHAHRNGISHGNISVESIVIDREVHPLVIGFGTTAAGSVTKDINDLAILLDQILVPPVPPELNAVLKKGMSQTACYASAADFAADIRHFQYGYPVTAYTGGISYRVLKAASRNRALIAIAILAVAAIVVAGVLWFQRYSQRKEEVEGRREKEEGLRQREVEKQRTESEAARKKSERERIVNALLADIADAHKEALAMRKSGRPQSELVAIVHRIKSSALYKQVESEAADDASVRYSFGKLYKMIGKGAEAGEEFLAILKLDPTDARASYELGILSATHFHESLAFAHTDWLKAHPTVLLPPEEKFLTPMSKKLKEGAVKALNLAASILQQDSIESQTARGTLAAIDNKTDEAKKLLRHGLELDRSFDDAVAQLVYVFEGAHDYAAGMEILDAAIPKDLGNSQLLSLRAIFLRNLGVIAEGKGKLDEGKNYFERSIKDWERASEIVPTAFDIWKSMGDVRLALAVMNLNAGRDPGADFTAAIENLDKAVELAKNDPDYKFDSLQVRAAIFQSLALYQESSGTDSSEAYRKAIADYSAAIELSPRAARDCSDVYSARGLMYNNLAGQLVESGKDALEMFKKAQADLDKSIELNDVNPECRATRGGYWMNLGIYKKNSGEDPSAEFRKSKVDMDRAIELDPEDAGHWSARGLLFTNWGEYELTAQGNPTANFQRAVPDFAQALKINPADIESLTNRGNLWRTWAIHKMQNDESPDAEFKNALADFDAVLKLNPKDADSWMIRGFVWSDLAGKKLTEDADASGEIANSLRDFDNAIALNPNLHEAWLGRGTAYFEFGQSLEKSGKPAEAVTKYEASLADWKKAVNLNPAIEDELPEKPEALREKIKKLRSDY